MKAKLTQPTFILENSRKKDPITNNEVVWVACVVDWAKRE